MIASERLPETAGAFRRLRALLGEQLRQGLSPRQLALALALGATIGAMPLVWGTSLICILLAGSLKLNQAVVQLGNYLVYPLQILLFLPYLKWGERLFSTRLLPADCSELLDQLKTTPLLFFEQFWQANLQAVPAWLLSAPVLLGCFFYFALVLFRHFGPGPDE